MQGIRPAASDCVIPKADDIIRVRNNRNKMWYCAHGLFVRCFKCKSAKPARSPDFRNMRCLPFPGFRRNRSLPSPRANDPPSMPSPQSQSHEAAFDLGRIGKEDQGPHFAMRKPCQRNGRRNIHLIKQVAQVNCNWAQTFCFERFVAAACRAANSIACLKHARNNKRASCQRMQKIPVRARQDKITDECFDVPEARHESHNSRPDRGSVRRSRI